MPLLDHFRPPFGVYLPWDTLHSSWATQVARTLNRRWLPPPFVAFEHTHVGPHIEIDIATFERPTLSAPVSENGGSVATLLQTWAPPAAMCTVPIVLPDRFEILVYSDCAPWKLVGVIEFVSPSNKDRPEERQAFAAKCAAYLHRGFNVVLIDVVTNRRANLHNEVLRLMSVTSERAFLPEPSSMYAAAYRPALRGGAL